MAGRLFDNNCVGINFFITNAFLKALGITFRFSGVPGSLYLVTTFMLN